MDNRMVLVFVACLLGISWLTPNGVQAQAQPQAWTQHAQYGQYPPGPYYQDERERWREERKREEEYRREERKRLREEQKRERAQQQWYNEQWRRHNQRYFGGNPMAPYSGESYESYSRRVQAQCNILWDRCARYCNTIRNPNQRAACVGNCNNELNECNSWR